VHKRMSALCQKQTLGCLAGAPDIIAAKKGPLRVTPTAIPYDRPNQGTNPGCPASRAHRLADQTSLAVQQITDFAECAFL
jgi:hypothetical protein